MKCPFHAEPIQNIDLNQTPNDFSDDIEVDKAIRHSRNTIFYLRTIKVLTVGIGHDEGEFEFKLKNGGSSETYYFNYFSYVVSFSTLYLTDGEGFYLAATSIFRTSLLNGSKLGNFSGATRAVVFGYAF